jgi:1,4-alpha-glucan branching enzyme
VRVHPDGGAPVEATQVHAAGVWEAALPDAGLPLRYGLEVTYGTESFPVDDPYRFAPTLGDMDLHLAGEGRHEELYEKLGAHVRDVYRIFDERLALMLAADEPTFASWDQNQTAIAERYSQQDPEVVAEEESATSIVRPYRT